MRRSLRAILLALPLLAAPLAACGTEEASAGEIVRAAPAATVDESTARMAFEITVPGLAEAGQLTGEGVMDFEQGIGSLTFDLAAIAEAAGQAAPPDMDTEMEMVFEGTTYYMRFPMLTQAFGPEAEGKEWVKIDASAAAADAGIDLSQFQQMGNDPRQQLAYLTGVSDDIEEVGTEDVRGESTTHYRGTVTMDAVLEQLEDEDLVDLEQFRAQVDELGIEELPFDVWIDDEGRARRMEMAVPLPPEAGSDGEVEMVIEMFDFGTDVEVEPPAPEVTLDITEMAALGGAQGG